MTEAENFMVRVDEDGVVVVVRYILGEDEETLRENSWMPLKTCNTSRFVSLSLIVHIVLSSRPLEIQRCVLKSFLSVGIIIVVELLHRVLQKVNLMVRPSL
jgi:hypothetical protein